MSVDIMNQYYHSAVDVSGCESRPSKMMYDLIFATPIYHPFSRAFVFPTKYTECVYFMRG